LNDNPIREAITQIDATITNLQDQIKQLEATKKLLESQLPKQKPREDLYQKAQQRTRGHDLPGWTEQD
jgi:Tfp pilus assembly protein PilO